MNATDVWVTLETSWIPLSWSELPDLGIWNCTGVFCTEASILKH